MTLLGTHKTRSSPYHPASNGMVERMNRTLLDMIAIFVNDNQLDWDQQLPLLTAAYRSCVHDTTKYTPNMLMFGRETYLPFHCGTGKMSIDPIPVDDNYVSQLQTRLDTISEVVRENLHSAAVRQKREYDTRKHEHRYETGSLVYRLDKLRTIGKSPKLKASPWKGPNVVIRKISDLLYEVKPSAAGKSKVMHHDMLKPYVSEEVPEWAAQLRLKLKPAPTTTNGPDTTEKQTVPIVALPSGTDPTPIPDPPTTLEVDRGKSTGRSAVPIPKTATAPRRSSRMGKPPNRLDI